MKKSNHLARLLGACIERPSCHSDKRGEDFASLHVPFPFFRDRLSLSQILACRSRKVMNFGRPTRPIGTLQYQAPPQAAARQKLDQRGTTAVASISTFAASSTRRTTWINAMAG